MSIHPTAIVSDQAKIGSGVEIGPFSFVEADARLGDRCRLDAHVSVKSHTVVGAETHVYEGAILGGTPQHLQRPERTGNLVIGERNVIREHVTIHRALHEGHTTLVGDDCMLMVGCHIAHDCQIGDRVILTNGVMVGGHVQIGDRACLGGNAAIHQHCRIGRLAMIGGCTKVVQDIPPYVLTDGGTATIVGLNRIGLRRAGIARDEVLNLKAAYRLIYREDLTFSEVIAALEHRFPTGLASDFAEFFKGGSRGFVQERRHPPRVILRVHPGFDDEAAHRAPRLRRVG